MKNNTNGLKNQLEKLEWPGLYLFKFIVPVEKLDSVLLLFQKQETKIRLSGKGNYASVSATPFMLNADKVIEKYEEAGKIEGCLAL